MKFLIFGLVFQRAIFASAAEGPLTVQEAIQEAMSQSPELQIANSQARQAHWRKMEGWQMFVPSVGLSLTDITQQNYIYTNLYFGGANVSVPGIVPEYMMTLNAKLPLFNGFVSTNRFNALSEQEEAAKKEASWQEFKHTREVELQFYKAYGAKILVEAAEQNLATFQDHLKDVQDFKRQGISTNYDLLRVEVQTSLARTELFNAKDNLHIERSKLTEDLGLETDERPLDGKFPEFNEQTIASLQFESVGERQDIEAMQKRVSASEDLDRASSRYLVPEIAAFGNYFYYNNLNYNIPDSSSFRDAYQIGFTLNWNLFDGLASYSKSHQAIEQKYQAEKGLRALQLHAREDFDHWKRKFLYYSAVYHARLEDVEKSKETVRLAREGRKVGARTNSDLLDAERELYSARASVVTSLLGAVEALLNLEMTTGKTLLKVN